MFSDCCSISADNPQPNDQNSLESQPQSISASVIVHFAIGEENNNETILLTAEQVNEG
jgi:hypothetical protein